MLEVMLSSSEAILCRADLNPGQDNIIYFVTIPLSSQD